MGQVCPFTLGFVHVKRHAIHTADIVPTQLASSLIPMFALLAASVEGIDLGRLLLDLTLMLVMAKIAAEIFDRLHIPVVIGEIGVGIVLGPSLLGWVRAGDIVFFLAEIGVIVLLAQVGMETDIDELRRVGRSSLSVGLIGVIAPMALGYFAATALGEPTNTALFVGAALTATSIGITARVFGDLRALSTQEARTVLGAAVTDDVLGLIILTVVTRIVQQGSVDFATVSSTIGLAVGFLVVAGVIGLFVFPELMRRIGSVTKSSSTIPVVGISLILAFSVLADLANLAPIIGAFVAGLGLRKVAVHERIERDLSSLGQIFVPVFFLYIGISTDVSSMLDGRVLLVAGLLSVLAIAGKLVSALGALGTTSDKLVIGFGMMPRGEVGLIFATIGLSVGALNDELYGSILVVVLFTTLIAPPLLRWRIGKSKINPSNEEFTPEPSGGWLTVESGHVRLNGHPSSTQISRIALDAALLVVDSRPSGELLDWFAARRNDAVTWDTESTHRLIDVLRNGNARSWRFLDTIGFIQRALPELADAMAARASDSTELDPTHALHFPTVESISSSTHVRDSDSDELILAAFAKDIADSGADGTGALRRLAVGLNEMSHIARIIDGSTMLRSVVTTEPMKIDQRLINQLANHLHSPRVVEQCRHLSAARGDFNDRQYGALIEIVAEIQEVLSHPDLMQSETNTVLESRLTAAKALTTDTALVLRISNAPASYALNHSPEEIFRHAQLVEPCPRAGQVRVAVLEGTETDSWVINVATRDRTALLARVTRVLSDCNLEVMSADIATWEDGAVLDVFTVKSDTRPSEGDLTSRIEGALVWRSVSPSDEPLNLAATCDNDAHPWHSILRMTGPDRHGLLRDITAILSKLNVSIHLARISTDATTVRNEFEVSDRHGRKLADDQIAAVVKALR